MSRKFVLLLTVLFGVLSVVDVHSWIRAGGTILFGADACTHSGLNGTRVALYNGSGAEPLLIIAMTNLFEWMGCSVTTVRGDDIKKGCLDNFDVLAWPGGHYPAYWDEMGLEGKSRVQEFVNGGGGYFGICAGAYYACDYMVWQGWKEEGHELNLHLFPGVAHGPINEIAEFPENNMTRINIVVHTHPITDSLPEYMQILYWGGPYLQPYEDAEVTILGTYDLTGTPAIVAFQYGQGRVFLTGPHPEIEEDSDRDGWPPDPELSDEGSDWPLLLESMRWLTHACIHIRANGSVDPPTAPISSDDNITYTFTDNIYEEIAVERDNIVIDGNGYTLQGTGTGSGFDLSIVSGVTVKNTHITNFQHGIFIYYYEGPPPTEPMPVSNTISNNTITDCSWCAIFIFMWDSTWTVHGHRIIGNTIRNDMCGVALGGNTRYNNVYHNNFLNNTHQAQGTGQTNWWNNEYPSGGNYWSDYTGVDVRGGPYQNETGSDGIGDTPYVIDENNIDHYPLMGIFSDFNVTWEEETYHVNIISNSTVSNFKFEEFIILPTDWVREIHFSVTGEDGTLGFCRTCIPTGLLNDTYKVFVNDTEVPHTLLPCSNSTHSYLYFTYNHSTQEVMIVPEFPSFLIPPLFMIATLLAVIVYRRKYSM